MLLNQLTNESRTVSMEELPSIHGFYITHMGGPIYWDVNCKKRRSRSSCMTKIKSIDAGIKGIQYLRYLMKQLGLHDIDYPTPLWNNNQDSIDLIKSGCCPTTPIKWGSSPFRFSFTPLCLFKSRSV